MKFRTALKLSSLVIVLVVLCGIRVFAADTSFDDLPVGSAVARAAEYLSENKIITGYPDGTFRKDNTLTRAELCTMLCRVLHMEDAAESGKDKALFTDIDKGHWANGYVNAAFDKKIVNGYADKTFKPDSNVRVEEAVKMIVCLMYAQDEFAATTPWYQCYLDKAESIGLLDGIDCEPGEEITRGETAILLYNAYTRFGGKYSVSVQDRSDYSIRRDFTTVNEGLFSYCLESGVGNDLRVCYREAVEPDSGYVVSVDIKTENVVNLEGENEFVGANVSTGNYVYSNGGLGTSDWNTVSVIGKSDSEGNLLISLDLGYWLNNCSGKVWFENVRYQKVEDFEIEDHNWRFLWAVVKNVDVDHYDEAKKRTIKEKSSLSDAQIDKIKSVAKDFESVLAEKSEGKLVPKVEVVVLDSMITEIENNGERSYWFSGAGASKLLKDAGINSREYDHVAVISKFDRIPADDYWALGGTFISGYTGYTFARYVSGNGDINYGVMWHEFLHSAESRAGFYMGYEIPGLHDKALYRYTEVTDDNWYTDYTNCRVKNCRKAYHGIPGFIWNLKPTLFN